MNDGDARLVQRARAGDREAFACLIARHLPLMRGVCRRLLGTDDGLEDVVQEAALQAFLGLDRLREPLQFGPWLAGIGLNVARRIRRAQARNAWSWEALTGGGLVLEPIEDSPGPDQLAEASELAGAVRQAVAALPTGQRTAILLVYLSGLTYRETASVLGIQVGALKTRLHKGRRTLQHRLRDLWMEDLMTTTRVEQELVEMRVADVRRTVAEDDKLHGRSIILLEEVGAGQRQLPIWVGNWEGDSIAMLLEKLKVPRPLTHAFTASLLRAGGVRVVEVRIHRLAEETFYAQVVLNGGQGEQAVDARPSDCIALALELGTPIYVANDVVETVTRARAASCADDQQSPPVSIGAAEIVDYIVEHWPREPKPIR
jgi:RNA polymerase sigma-70 factor (ECF subfamily)